MCIMIMPLFSNSEKQVLVRLEIVKLPFLSSILNTNTDHELITIPESETLVYINDFQLSLNIH